MTTFLRGLAKLIEQDVLLRGLIATVLLATLCYMYIMQMTVPAELINVTSVVLGFYFGGVSTKQVERLSNNGKTN